MKQVQIKKLNKVSYQRKSIMNRLQKYTLESQGLAVLSGVLGQTAISSAAITMLDVGTLTSGSTLNAAGTGSLGLSVQVDISQSSSPADSFTFVGNTAGVGTVRATEFGGNAWATEYGTVGYDSLQYFAAGSTVDETFFFGYGDITSGLFGNVRAWIIDRPNGAIAFKNGDGEYGYMFVDWNASSKTLKFLGSGFFDNTPGTAITVGAVPEPADYAAALGLGALGLAYYRQRSGNKTRSKK